MIPCTLDRLAVLAAALALVAGCQTTSTPKPVKAEGWDEGAGSAANAPPTAEITSGRAGKEAAHQVVRTAAEQTLNDDERPDTASNDDKIGRRELDSRPSFSDTPAVDADPIDVAGWISKGRERGKSGRALQRPLDETEFEAGSDHRMYWAAGDFDGDDRDDLAVVFWAGCDREDCEGETGWTVGIVWGDRTFTELGNSPRRRPNLLKATDLTGDGRPEIGFTRERCGAHTCRIDLEVYTGHGRRDFRRVLDLGDDGTDRGTGTPQSVDVERDDDERPRIVARGGRVGSVGGGPFQRTWRDTWRWEGQEAGFELAETDWESSNLALHRLHDALRRLVDEDFEGARERLEEVIEDDELEVYPDAHEADSDRRRTFREQLAATARFLLARIALQEDRQRAYQRHVDDLMERAPHSPAASAARRLAEALETEGNLAAACQLAATSFPDQPDDDWLLDSHELGYNAPVTFDGDRKKGLCTGL
ncbi:MAG: hypothetical protein ACOCV2_08870 [Persicimonas sp.]